MAGIGNFDVTAVLKANVSDFQRGMAQAQASFKSFQSATGSTLQNVGATMAGVGKAMTIGLTAPIIAGAGASVKAFADFETAMRGVSKTTDLTGAEFDKMSSDILKMSRTMPVAATEIAGVTEAAGQLGIKKENLLGFTETMVKLGTSTNMSSEEAATALARLANITQMPQDQFENLGSTVVALGNNMATTESEIVNMAQRLAGTGSMIGLTEAQIMALSASMSSVGIEAEAGGTAMSTALKKMDSAVRESGEELNGFAQVAGMTSEEFATAWQNDPQTAITAFVEGLGKMQKNGDDVNGMLDALGIKGIRETDTLLRLAGAGELTGEAFDIANQAWKENSALSKEAEEAWSTLSSKSVLLWNAVKELAITIGTLLAPAITKVVEKATEMVHVFLDMDENTQKNILSFVAMAAAVGPVLIILGKMLTVVAKFKAATTIMQGFATVFPNLALGVKALGASLAFLTSPIGLVIAAFVALGVALTYLYKQNEDFRNMVDTAWASITTVISDGVETVKTFIGSLIDRFKEFITNNQDLLTSTQGVWEGIKTAVMEVVNAILPILAFAWDAIIVKTVVTWNLVKGAISIALELILGIVETMMHLLNGDWEAAWNTIKETATNIWNIIVSSATEIFQILSRFFSDLWTSISTTAIEWWEIIKQGLIDRWNLIVESVATIWDAIKEYFANLWTGVQENFNTTWEGIKTYLSGVWTSILDTATTAWTSITTFFTSILSLFAPIFQPIFDGIKNIVSNTWTTIQENSALVWNSIMAILSATLLTIVGLVTGDFDLIKQAITNAWDMVKSNTSQVWQNILSLLSSTWSTIKATATAVFDGIKMLISNAWNAVATATSNAWNNIQQSLANAWNNIKSTVSTSMSNVNTSISTGWQNAKQAVSTAMQNIQTAIQNGWNNAVSAVTTAGQNIVSSVRSSFSNAISSANSFASQAVSVGQNLIMGFVNGVKAKASALVDSVKGAVSGAINAAKNLLGIHSPSRVFRQFGIYTDQGFAIGIDKEAKTPIKSMRNMIDGIVSQGENGLNSGFGGLQGQLNGMVNSAVTTDVRSTLDYSNKPAYINLNMGGQTYRAYVEDISSEQTKRTNLELGYL
ncbi:phage tail tape measure protein [Aerococcus urinaeequi]|uniref:phage tail tape measure protein n=1 Tax=Aerococcus urinaeequi TaxID=51665 RepID=UPI003D6B1D89